MAATSPTPSSPLSLFELDYACSDIVAQGEAFKKDSPVCSSLKGNVMFAYEWAL